MRSSFRLALALSLPLALGCESSPGDAASPWDDADFTQRSEEVVEQYVHVIMASYADSLSTAETLQAAVEGFLAAPSEAGLTEAREAWLAAREIYGQTEVYRFYDGPIDAAPDNLEGEINSWPMDEVYIDYTVDQPEGGVINDLTAKIDRATLVALNGDGGENNISTGWHAIEFLLWGQDLSADGPGARPFTDFITDGTGTASNQDRRGDYLKVVTDLLVDDLGKLVTAWNEGATYHKSFESDPRVALTNILLGMGSLSGAELSGERMGVAFKTREQEDEHSCFSDNTHRDIYANALGIENVYLGRFGTLKGTSLGDLVASRDAALDSKLREQLRASIVAIEAIPAPFDNAIQAPDGDPARQSVADAIAALKAQTTTIAEVAALFELELNLEE